MTPLRQATPQATRRYRSVAKRLAIGAVATIGLLASALPAQAAAPAATASAARGGAVVDARDFGARCDGTTDDRSAIDAGLQALAATGGTLRIPSGTCRVNQSAARLFIGVPSGVEIVGTGSSEIALTCDPDAEYVELFRVGGQNIALRNLRLTRAGACNGALIAVHQIQGLTLDGVSFVGNAAKYEQYVHGLLLQSVEGPSSDLVMSRVSMTDLDYGLVQPSTVTTTFDRITVDRSSFSGNFADDLEFNAPAGLISNVVVTNSRFKNNRSNGESSGFGIGLANVSGARIQGNQFNRYRFEPVHIEDRSTRILVQGNRFRRSFTEDRSYASHVFIVSGSTQVDVVGNTFDTGRNCNRIQAVFVNAGGAGYANPSGVLVKGNKLMASKTASLAYHDGIDVSLKRNKISPARGRC